MVIGWLLREKVGLRGGHNTVIIVTSDNGMPFPRAKGNNYEYSHYMPLAITWSKGISHPGRVESGYTSFVDIAPTMLELAGSVSKNVSEKEPSDLSDQHAATC